MDQQMIIIVVIIVCCCCSLSIGGGIGGYLYTTAADAEKKKKEEEDAAAAEEEAAAAEKKKKATAAAAAKTPATTTPAATTPAATTPAATTPASDKYINVGELDYAFNDLGMWPTSNVDECATYCNQNSECNLFTINTTGNNCWIKSKAENRKPETNRRTYFKKGYLVGMENETANFNCEVDSGAITYGAQGKTITYNIPTGTRSVVVNNTTMGNDPIFGVLKSWNAKYKCK